MARHRRPPLLDALRLSPLQVFGAAFMLLAAAVVAVALGQFLADPRAPWISIGFSAAAAACTVVAVLMRRRPRP
jgi:hypothetical protein